MTKRKQWAIIPGFFVVAAVAAGLSAYSGATARQANAAQAPSATGYPTFQNAGPAGRNLEGVRNNTEAQALPVIKGDSGLMLNPAQGTWAYSGASSPQGYSPEQPVRFPHPQHVQKLGMNCTYCHYSAGKSNDPGLPSVQTCMGCHTLVAAGKPEIKKLANYYAKNQPVPWARIHKVPEYVHFPHSRHANGGVTCQTCHGQVQQMTQVFQYASLNMGWCVNCHIERKARYDCATCHY
jgi:hypothetical protein